ncbi:winged helix-turn-helix domain-containing protein [Tessaracoccus sp. OS52]|uniref:winged helix-turn-helix domain-containing protein n=1 Tax=Tessaracoccus sp. OS52 TaxID=2886691 RepID=UPI001D110BBB|nr:winged helix-turn-helix domain-containing protein [Tessaracoccus sp. OS52]MCC2593534.1 winged helix-turn-helix domain-containing protein [Tessaracoccus sp. OS52]
MNADQLIVHEPERIRALAHPLRLQLLDLLTEHDELTATQCAEFTGESVASCSFHLRTLEKYGYIERAQSRGRERPWRRAGQGGFKTEADPDVPETMHASTELAVLSASHRVQGFQRAMAHVEKESMEWLEATQVSNVGFWATAEETAQLGADIMEVLVRFKDRRDAAQRPAGARWVHALSLIYADPQ